jgi:hypothetical protein
MRNTGLIFLLILLNSCGVVRVSSGSEFDRNKVTKVDFCDLSEYKNELVKTKLEYSGVDEYWSASGFNDCELDNAVYLEFEEYYKSWKHILIEGQLNRLQDKYWKRKAVMTVIGRFEMDSIRKYGHLGSNNAQILVKSVRINLKRK